MGDNQQPTGENVFDVWWNSKGIYYELLEPEHFACLNEILKKKSLSKLICDCDAHHPNAILQSFSRSVPLKTISHMVVPGNTLCLVNRSNNLKISKRMLHQRISSKQNWNCSLMIEYMKVAKVIKRKEKYFNDWIMNKRFRKNMLELFK